MPINFNSKLYEIIVKQIIEPGLNKFDARNELAKVLESYKAVGTSYPEGNKHYWGQSRY